MQSEEGEEVHVTPAKAVMLERYVVTKLTHQEGYEV